MNLSSHKLGGDFAALALLAGAVCVVYWQTAGFGFITADDSRYIVNNPMLQEGFTLGTLTWVFSAHLVEFSPHAEYWSPLVLLSRLLDVSLYGLQPGGHHFTNLLLHGINVWLVYLLARLWKTPLWAGFGAALLFAIHPLNAEVVCWLSARKDLLAGTFFLTTLLAYSRFLQRPCRAAYAWVLISFLMAMMSKPMVVTLPLIFLLMDFWPGRRWSWASLRKAWRSGRRLGYEKIPFFLLAAFAALLAWFSQKMWGATEILRDVPFHFRLGNAGESFVAYLKNFVWPSDLAIFYPHPGLQLSWTMALGSWLLLGLITLVVWRLRLRKPWLAVGWFGFVIGLLPVIGLLQIGGHSHADRYMYLPMLGLILILGMTIARLGPALKNRPLAASAKAWLAAALIIWFGYLGYTTHRQAATWESDLTVWKNAVARTPWNFTASYELGRHLIADGDWRAGLRMLRFASASDPSDVRPWLLGGGALQSQGKWEQAWIQYVHAFQIAPDDPLVQAHMIDLLEESGRGEEALILRRRFEEGKAWQIPRQEPAEIPGQQEP